MFAVKYEALLVAPILLMTVAGCSRHSEDFEKIKRADESKWVSIAQLLPINRRISLYNELYHFSHPPNTVISSAFRDQPTDNLKLIIDRMALSDNGDALSYLPIIDDLERSNKINICGTNNMKIIRKVLSRKNYDQNQKDAINTWQIGKCRIDI